MPFRKPILPFNLTDREENSKDNVLTYWELELNLTTQTKILGEKQWNWAAQFRIFVSDLSKSDGKTKGWKSKP